MENKDYYLAIDLGASSGRAALASVEDGRIQNRIIHRFKKYQHALQGHYHWDIITIFAEIKKAIKMADDICGGQLVSVGIDSWGVDYGYLDGSGALIGNPYHYRDTRTEGMYSRIFQKIAKEEIYALTGIQFMDLNTIAQLYADRVYRPWVFDAAEVFLMIPDLLNYLLTGQKRLEVTNLSTTQLFNPQDMALAAQILESLDIPASMFPEINNPGVRLGTLDPGLIEELNLKNAGLQVVSVASHDTASAIAAIPTEDSRSVYIINGTWSLLGLELESPMINQEVMRKNFTNEVGVEGSVRFLKNITGLWLLEESKKQWEKDAGELSYEDLIYEAEEAEPGLFKIDPEDSSFARHGSIPTKIKEYCYKTGQRVPETRGQIVRGIYESLACSYSEKIKDLECITDGTIERIHMAGGGAKSSLFCRIVEEKCDREVVIGPIEATVYGNILAQLKAAGTIESIRGARKELVQQEKRF